MLQRIDGLSLPEVWRYNAYVLPPTVSIYLEDEHDVIRARLAARGPLSRLELTASPGRELLLYQEAATFLQKHDWEQVAIDCRGKKPEQVVAAILKQLARHLK